jgi:hypothetical protein
LNSVLKTPNLKHFGGALFEYLGLKAPNIKFKHKQGTLKEIWYKKSRELTTTVNF